MKQRVSVFTRAHAHSVTEYLSEAMHCALNLPLLGKTTNEADDVITLVNLATMIGNANSALNKLLTSYYDCNQVAVAIDHLKADAKVVEEAERLAAIAQAEQQGIF